METLMRAPVRPRSPSAHLGTRGDRGAVYVEFLIAFFPVFTFFLSLMQLAFVYTTQLFVEHTATVAARTAALALGKPEGSENASEASKAVPLSATRQALVRKAAVLTLAPFILDGTIDTLEIEYPSTAEPKAPTNPKQTYAAMDLKTTPLVRVRVKAKMYCKIMIANHLVCGGLGGSLFFPTMWLQAESVFPVERASYQPSTSCAGSGK
jgi:hypothetical protein